MPVITELLARLGVDTRDFDRKLHGAEKSLRASAARSAQIGERFNRALSLVISAVAVRAIVRTVDAYTQLQNRLRAVTTSAEELARIQNRLFEISRQTRSSVEGNVELFSRLRLATKDLGTSESELLTFTKSLNQAIKLSGATATEAQAGILQLAQGMASGVLRGDELRSVLEQLPAVADVIAKSLGITRGQLRELGSQGKITADVILKAFAGAREELAERFAKTVPTIDEAVVVLKDSFTRLVGEVANFIGLGSNLSEVLTNIATLFDGITESLKSLEEIWQSAVFRRTPFSAEQLEELRRLAGGATPIVREFEERRPAAPPLAAKPIAPGEFFSQLGSGDFIKEINAADFSPLLGGLQEIGRQASEVFGGLAGLTGETFRSMGETIDGVIVTNAERMAMFFDDIATKQQQFALQANEAWSSWLAQASDVTANIKLATLDFFQSFASGLGDAVAQIIVFKADAEEVFKSLLKNILAQIIASLVKIVVEFLIASIARAIIGSVVHALQVTQAIQLIFLNTWASIAAIPIVGPILAPAAAAAAAKAAGPASAAAGAAGGSSAITAVPLEQGGLITAEGLAFLHAGEVVATPDEVTDAMRGGGGLDFTLAIDGRTVARAILPHIPRELRMRGV